MILPLLVFPGTAVNYCGILSLTPLANIMKLFTMAIYCHSTLITLAILVYDKE
jgi:hypothetical protein